MLSNKLFSVALILLSLSWLAGCGNDPFEESDFGQVPMGAYRYLGYSSEGSVIVRGWLLFTDLQSPGVSGAWNLQAAGIPANIGPQIGTGNFQGGFTDNNLVLVLHPFESAENVSLAGNFDNEEYSGRWTYFQPGGPVINRGTFEARK